MTPLQIVGSERSPEVSFNASDNSLKLKGRSQPEDLLEFYQPVLAWYEEYIDQTKGPVQLHIELDYFNTGTARVLFEIFQKLKKAHERGVKYEVHWVHDDYDEDMREAAQHLGEITGIAITLIEN